MGYRPELPWNKFDVYAVEVAKLTKKLDHHPAASNFRKQKETSALLIAKKERERYNENSVS